MAFIRAYVCVCIIYNINQFYSIPLYFGGVCVIEIIISSTIVLFEIIIELIVICMLILLSFNILQSTI